MGGHDQSQVKIKFKKFEKIKSVPKDVPKSHNDDTLDECKDEEPASAILSILSRYVNEIPNVKFFITGRPESRIRSGFCLESLVLITEILKLHEVKPETVDSDIELFFQTQLTDLAKN